LFVAVSIATTEGQTPAVNPTGAAIKSFHDQLDAYMKLRNKAGQEVPPLKETDDPAQISAREHALADAIRKARRGARIGDIFVAEARPVLIRAIRTDWKRRPPKDRTALFRELPRQIRLDVNSSYPSSFPLLTFPPELLAELPPLPDGLEYRFVGRDLILRDVEANLVVDVLKNVIPR
jgi:hypothetical protein